jgi:hypothetical protein
MFEARVAALAGPAYPTYQIRHTSSDSPASHSRGHALDYPQSLRHPALEVSTDDHLRKQYEREYRVSRAPHGPEHYTRADHPPPLGPQPRDSRGGLGPDCRLRGIQVMPPVQACRGGILFARTQVEVFLISRNSVEYEGTVA